MLKRLLVISLAAAAIACGGESEAAVSDSAALARTDSINRAQPGYVIDSILPPEEEMRRFRASFPGDSATEFIGGRESREALVKAFITAVAAADTSTLRAMVIHGREFADLYYPESPYARAPYRQPPSFAWRLIQDPSAAGLTSLLRRLGGTPVTYLSHRCDPKVVREGRTTRYAGCLVQVRNEKGAPQWKRLFGSIVERDKQYKFLSYTNDI